MATRLAEIQAMIQRILGVPTLLKKSLPHNYVDSPFFDSISLVEMPKKFTFPNMKLHDGTKDPNNHIASYNQIMFTSSYLASFMRHACAKVLGPA